MKKYSVYIFTLLGFVLRFLTGNLYGVLILLLVVYFSIEPLWEIPPLTIRELLLILDGYDSSEKALFLSSSLTVIGFLIALSVATISWKQQIQASLRLQAASDINSTYNRISTHLVDINIFASSLIRLADKIKSEQRLSDFDYEYLLSQYDKFASDRQAFCSAYRQSLELLGSYSQQLFAAGDSFTRIQEIGNELGRLNSDVWFCVPVIALNEQERSKIYLSSLDYDKIKDYIELSDKIHDRTNALSGIIRGKLTTPLIEANWSTFRNFAKHGVSFFTMMEEIIKKK